MKQKIYIILLMLWGTAFSLWAQTEGQSTGILLEKLDDLIADKAVYHEQREMIIKRFKAGLASSETDIERYAFCDSLFHMYLHYQADSAQHYIRLKEKYLQPSEEHALENEIRVNRAEVMGVMGMYNEAFSSLLKVDSRQLDNRRLGYFYRTFRACYGWLADNIVNVEERKKYLDKADVYRDSAIAIMPAGADRRLMEVEVMLRNNQPEKTIRILDSLRNCAFDERFLAYVNFTEALAWEQLHKTDKVMHCLAQTAIVDLNMGVREYAGLPWLARLIYESGDTERAYRYLKCSMKDAVDCNARLRYMEVTEFYPIIDKAYMEKEAQERRMSRIVFWGVCALAVLFVVLAVYMYYGIKKLSQMRRHLFAANRELRAMNAELVQTGKIKEVYIARYLDRCVGYLEKLEQYRRSLEKLAMASRLEDLFKAIRSEQFLKDERKCFYNEFDRSFLDLFPNFVNDFNNLLVEEGRIFPKSGEILNTELRIFALIRLGVTDSNRIAHFLGYSLATVYNYRSKIRNKAKGDKDSFEKTVMNL